MAKAKTKEAQSLFDSGTTPEIAVPNKKSEIAVLPANPDLTTAAGRMGAILGVMSRPGMDAATAREWRELYREMQTEDQDRAFNAAMHAAQSEMPRIARDKQADRFKYATLENVSRQIDPVARKHGFVLSYGTSPPTVPGNIAMFVDVMHTAGCVRRYSAPELKPDMTGLKGEPNKTSTQGSGASISYMRRYLKCMVFDVVISGEDIDGGKAKRAAAKGGEETGGEGRITQKQAEQLMDLCEAVECPKEKFLKHMAVAKIADMPVEHFDAAVNALRGFDATRKERAAKGAAK